MNINYFKKYSAALGLEMEYNKKFQVIDIGD